MSSRIRLSCIALPAMTAVFMLGCIDPKGDFDDFEDRAEEFEGNMPDAAPPADTPPGGFVEVDGEFLLGIQVAALPGSAPLRLVVTADTTPNKSGGGSTDLVFQALIADRCAMGMGGQDAGDPLPPVDDVPVNADGSFNVSQPGATVPGLANPLTCSDIIADIEFIGRTVRSDFICGDVAGMVMQPVMIGLAGSTFGAVQIATGTRGDANLPPVVASCAE